MQEAKGELLHSVHCEGLVLGSMNQEASCMRSIGRDSLMKTLQSPNVLPQVGPQKNFQLSSLAPAGSQGGAAAQPALRGPGAWQHEPGSFMQPGPGHAGLPALLPALGPATLPAGSHHSCWFPLAQVCLWQGSQVPSGCMHDID